MPAQQQFVTVQMRRKPTDKALAEAKAKGHAVPPAMPVGTFQVRRDTVDKTRAAAREEAARRLGVDGSKLIVSFSPVGEDQHKVIVTAPAE